MRTLMIVNELIEDAVFDAVGGFNIFKNGFKNPTAGISNLAGMQPIVKGDVLTAVNSLLATSVANQSYKNFHINPYNFTYSRQNHNTNVSDTVAITFPTGNYTLVEPFVGGILVRKHDKDKNVFKTLALVEFETSQTSWANIQTAVVAKLDTLTSYLGSKSVVSNVVNYNLLEKDITIEFLGSLSVLRSVKTFGEVRAITGTEVAKLERELMPNSGYSNTIDKFEAFNESLFIANPAKNYDMIVINTQMPTERPLLKDSDGLITTLILAIPTDATGVANAIVDFLNQVTIDPTGQLVDTEEL